LSSNGQLVEDDLKMCEEFNSYFSSVFTREDTNMVLPEAEKLFNADLQEGLLTGKEQMFELYIRNVPE
jgi:hypothetical protein